MKKFKKIFAVLLTLAMVMGMSMTTFAAGKTATINLSGGKVLEGAAIQYVQIVEPDTKSTIGWKFSHDDFATAFKTAFKVKTNEEALNKVIALQADTNAANGTINSSEELGKALAALQNKATSTTGVANSKITGLDSAGLYLITATKTGYTYMPMMAYIADSGSGNLVDASVTVKGSENIVTKDIDDADDQSVSEGDEVEYTATVQYPYYSPEVIAKTFTATDTLTNGTFKENSLVITVAGEQNPLVADTDYTVNAYAGTTGLSIDFGANYNANYAGKTVTIKYTAIVGAGDENVTNNISTNFDTDGDSVIVAKVSVKVTKLDDDSAVLGGATFTLYEVSETEVTGYTEKTDANVMENGSLTQKTIWIKEVGTPLVTPTEGDNKGIVTFTGLDAQKKYCVKETNAPLGYTVNDRYYKLEGAAKTSQDTSKVYIFNNFNDITVDDVKVSALPSTGGIGTTIFTIGGCLIMIVAAGLFFANRKKSNK